MRILHLDTGRTMRGGQHQVLLLIEGLDKIGYNQVLLSRAPLLGKWHGQPIGVTSLLQEAKTADLIHAHDSTAHTLAALWCPHKPLVVSRRVAFGKKHGLLSRLKYSRVKRFLAVSQYVANQLRATGVNTSKIEVVYDAVRIPASSNCEPTTQKSELIVSPYSNDPLKKGELLQTAVRQAGLSLRPSHNLLADLRSASMFTYLSTCEGLGSAILLAMAFKVPVVASRTGGIPEIVKHERTGLLVENDASEIAKALRRFKNNPTFAQECAERAHQKLLEHFTDDIMVRRTEQSYCKVLGLGTAS